MRLDSQKIYEITGRKRARGQAQWFKEFLGADVPCDRRGPILTVAAYEALVAHRLGVLPSNDSQTAPRPSVRLLGPKKAAAA